MRSIKFDAVVRETLGERLLRISRQPGGLLFLRLMGRC
jgi:hypothetical protein